MRGGVAAAACSGAAVFAPANVAANAMAVAAEVDRLRRRAASDDDMRLKDPSLGQRDRLRGRHCGGIGMARIAPSEPRYIDVIEDTSTIWCVRADSSTFA